MVRAAAKNHGGCAVVTDPGDYACVVEELRASGGEISAATRFSLAKKAFTHTARYDGAIANYLTSLDHDNAPQTFPERLHLAFDKVQPMRYGENPHQQAAFYREPGAPAGAIGSYTPVAGQRTVLQQYRRRGRRLGMRESL